MSGTTSGSSYTQSCFEIVTGAMRLCSAIQTGETPPDDELADSIKALNLMVKTWQASGIHVWAEEDCTLFLQPGQTSYQVGIGSPDHVTLSSAWTQAALTSTAAAGATSLVVSSISGFQSGGQVGVWLDAGTIFWTTVSGTPSGSTVALASALPSQASANERVVTYLTGLVRPLKVPQARSLLYAVSPGGQTIETPMSVYSLLDYAATPNKLTPGVTTALYWQPSIPLAQFSVWPAPADDTRGLKFTAQRPLNTFDTQASLPDFPDEWVEAMKFNLAVRISPEYDVPVQRYEVIKSQADELLGIAQTWDREAESVYFGRSAFPATRN